MDKTDQTVKSQYKTVLRFYTEILQFYPFYPF